MTGKNIIRKNDRWRSSFNWNTKESWKYDEKTFYIYQRNFNHVNVDAVEERS